MSPYSDFSYMFEDMLGSSAGMEAVGVFFVMYMIIMALSSAYSIFVYVLQSLGLYSIAKRRGIHNPWLSWIPVGNYWIVGSIADQYQYVAKGKVRNRRKVLLGLGIALYAMLAVIIVCAVVVLAMGISSGMNSAAMEAEIAGPAIIMVLAYFALFVLAVVWTVFWYIALYSLFESSNPESAIVFLILSIFMSFLVPYFIFACRKKDKGMPPRREQTPAYAPQPEQYSVYPQIQEPIYTEPQPEEPKFYTTDETEYL